MLAACGSDDATPSDTNDASTDLSDATADTIDDAVETDASADTAPEPDVAPDVAPDAAPDTRADSDAPQTINAVPGARCDLASRSGLVQLENSSGTYYLSASFDDRPTPWYGAPELTSEACDFYRFHPAGACPPCGTDELCGIGGTCSKAPLRYTDGRVTLTASSVDETFDAEPTTGEIFGTVTLPGPTFAFELSYGTVRIHVDATTAPGMLDALVGTLEGGYEAPTRLDVAWSTKDVGTEVFTHIPINHHAAGPTFTECSVSGASGGFSVGEAMLEPLAVVTGLEFQGIEHVRFAAAETPAGCVEVQFLERYYLNLF